MMVLLSDGDDDDDDDEKGFDDEIENDFEWCLWYQKTMMILNKQILYLTWITKEVVSHSS